MLCSICFAGYTSFPQPLNAGEVPVLTPWTSSLITCHSLGDSIQFYDDSQHYITSLGLSPNPRLINAITFVNISMGCHRHVKHNISLITGMTPSPNPFSLTKTYSTIILLGKEQFHSLHHSNQSLRVILDLSLAYNPLNTRSDSILKIY